MKIGLAENGYPIKRNILNKVPGYSYIFLRKNNNLFHTLSTLKNLVVRKKINFDGKYFYYQNPKIDVLHLYNDVNYSSQKWVASFETLIPRFEETKNDHQKANPSHQINKKTEKALQNITKRNCLGVISISQASANIQLELLKHYPHLEKAVKEKLHVIHPAQEVIEREHEKIYGNQDILQLIFIGTQFHLKGGVEMFEVLKDLRSKYKFTLTIISSFQTDHYVTKVSETEAQTMRQQIQKEDWVKIYEKIPNEEVLELIKKSHVGLLPTWSDTYGFSVLEMQAAGVPVITTDIRALPEINNESCGWLIHLPQNRLKQALYFNEEQKEHLKNTLKSQLENILCSIFENPHQLKEKSSNAVKRIQKEHNPEKVAEKLNEIYCKK